MFILHWWLAALFKMNDKCLNSVTCLVQPNTPTTNHSKTHHGDNKHAKAHARDTHVMVMATSRLSPGVRARETNQTK